MHLSVDPVSLIFTKDKKRHVALNYTLP